MATDVTSLQVRIDTTQVAQATNRMNALSSSANTTSNTFNNLKAVVAGFTLYQLTGELVKNADAWTELNNKIRLVTKTTEDFKKVQTEVFTISQKTNTDLLSTAELYRKLSVSTESLNVSQERLLKITETINKAGGIGGGSTESINAALIQLGQGLSSGALRGEELNSVLEQTPRLAKLIADGIGVATGELRGIAAEGKITNQVIIDAVESQAAVIDTEYKLIDTTISKAMVNVSNSILAAVGAMDEGSNASTKIAGSILELSEIIDGNKEDFLSYAKVIGSAIVTIGLLSAGTALAAKAQQLYTSFLATATVTTTSYNLATNLTTTSIVRLTLAQRAAAIATATLSAVMKTLPFVAVGAAVYALVDYLSSANGKMIDLKQSSEDFDKTVRAMTDNQLEYQKTLIESELIEQRLIMTRAKGDAAAQSFFESDEEHKKDLAYKDEQVKKFEDIRKKLVEIKRVQKELKEAPVVVVEDKEVTKVKDMSKTLLTLLDPIQAIKNKYTEYREELEKTGNATAENLAKLENLQTIEIENLNKKAEATESVTSTSLASWQNYYSTIGDYQTAWALRESEINEEYKDLTKEQLAELVAIQKKEYFDKIAELKSDEEIAEIDKNLDSYEEMLDYQLELIDATDMWNNSLDGVSKTIGNVMGAMNTLAEVDIKSKKKQAGTDADLAKAKAEFGEESAEYYKAEQLHVEETSKNKTAAQEAEYAGYSALAGAMASAYEQGSAGAILFTAAQSALGIASSWTAISAAWALGFPQNIPAVAMVTSAVMPIISQLGGGGGGGGSSAPSVMEVRQEEIDAHYEPILDKFDAQIKLLESIDKNGSAAKLEIDKAKTQYEFDFDTLINEAINNFGAEQGVQGSYKKEYAVGDSWDRLRVTLDNINEAFGQDIWTEDDSRMNLNSSMIADNESFLKYLGILAEENVIQLANWASRNLSAEQNLLNAEAKIFEVQEIMADFAVSSYESFSELNDAREDIGEMFDTITDSTTFAKMKIEESFKNVNQIVGEDETLENFLLKNIGIISDLKESFTDAELETLFSTQPEDFLTQQETLYKLNEKLGTAYKLNDESLKKLINSMDDFDIVAEALETSRGNIKDFTDSFKTDFQLAEDMAAKLGVEVATTFEEMNQQFIDMSSDIEGLTDTEADFLDITYDLTQSFKDAGDEMRSFITDYDLAMSLIGVEGTEATQLNLDSVNTKIDDLINSSIMTGVTQLDDIKTIAVLNKDKDTILNELLTAQVNSVGSTSEKGSVWEADRENFISFWEGLNKDTTLLGYQNAALDNVGLNIDFDDISNSSIEQLKYWITTAAVEGYRETYGESGESAISEMEKAFAAISTTYQTESVVGGGVVENYATVLAGATKENITDIIETILNKFGAESEAYTAAQNLADLFIEQAQLQYTIDNPDDVSVGTDTSTDDINNNIKIWLDSFKTATELATDLGVEVGKGLSTSMEDLSLVFDELKVGDLSDIELEFLQTNKAIIETTKSLQDEYDLLLLSDNATESLNLQRQRELDLLSDSDKVLQQNIYDEEDRQKALEESNAVLETSTNNIKSWYNDLRTPTDIAQNLGNALNADLSTSMEDLSTWFTRLSTDADGLTDKDLEFLNANKAIIETSDALQDEYDLLLLAGDATATLNEQRQRELDLLSDADKVIQQDIYDEEDRQEALEKSKAELEATQSLQDELDLLKLAGDDVSYLNEQRVRELELLSDTDAAIQRQINAEEDRQALLSQTEALQDEYDLLLLTGDDVAYLAEQRERELEEIDDSNKALQESIWLEEDRQKALEESNAILETYIENLANEKVAIIEQFEDIKDGISDTLKDLSGVKIKWDDILSLSQSVTTPEEAETLKSMIDTYYTQQTDLLSTQDSMLEDQKADEIDSLNTRLEVLNAEKDILDSFKDFATTLRTTQLEESGDTEALLNLFGDSFSKLNTALLAGEDGSDLATESMDYASSYLAALKESGTNREYEYEVSRLANQFEGYIGTGKEATISDLETELETLNKTQEAVYDLTYLQEKTIDGLDIKTASMLNTLDNKIDSNITRTNMELVNLQDTAIEYLGADSDIVYWLNAINDSTIDLNTSLSEWQSDRDITTNIGTDVRTDIDTSSNVPPTQPVTNYKGWNGDNVDVTSFSPEVLANFIDRGVVIPFADGGLVKGGMGGTLGLIGEKGYDELVVPLDNRDALGMNNFSKKLAQLNGIISNQNSLIMQQNNILTESRDLQNSSYVALKTIEELQ